MNLLTSPLLTDLYQLTMLHAYYAHGMGETAVFELFVRKLPPQRNFMIAAGLEQALEFLEHLRFTPEELEWVEKCGKFPRGFAAHLASCASRATCTRLRKARYSFPTSPFCG